MIYMVTWTSRDGEVHGVSASTLPEATTVYDALDYAGFAQVAVWNPKQVAVMVNGTPAGLNEAGHPHGIQRDSSADAMAATYEQLRADKGCTHPADQPCFSRPRLTSEGT